MEYFVCLGMSLVATKKTLGAVATIIKIPPDLDEVLRSLQEKLGGIFGGGRQGADRIPATTGESMKNLAFLAAGAVAIWGLPVFIP